MTEQQEQCCGNCRLWFKYWLCEGGFCLRDGLHMLASEGCSRWNQDRSKDGEQDDHDEEEISDD
jgi:hypothetical protein